MSLTKSWVALLCGVALAMPVAAQDEPAPKEPAPAEAKPASAEAAPAPKEIADPPLHAWGGFTVSLEAWAPTLIGADEEVATTNSGGIAQPVLQGSDANIETIVGLAYHLPHGFGSIVLQYDAMGNDDFLQNFTPGQFIFGETRAYPVLLGAFDDGLADGIDSNVSRTTREFRLDYQQQAFDSKWARGTWGVGYRQVSHTRDLDIAYYAIVPNLPPVIPPVVDENEDPLRLQPLPDEVTQSSSFSGHGLGVSLDVEFPLHPRVSLISGLSIGLLRGSADSSYLSQSSYYFLNGSPDVPLSKDELFALLSNPPPPTEPPDPPAPTIADVQQGNKTFGLNQTSNSQFAQTFDVYFGIEVTVYRGLKLFTKARDVYFNNVGNYVVPKPGPTNVWTSLSAGYEGYTLGLSWRF